MEIMRRARLRWRFSSAGLASDLAQRGLADPATSIRDYPYRDDAMLVHGAIRDFVADYVALYYHSDADVSHDAELQGWLTELRSADVAGLPDLPNRPALIDVVTQIIFTCSAQHAAVNYPQWEYMAFAPNMPAALWSDPRPDAAGVPRRDRFPLEPSKDKASYQIDTVAKLALFHFDQLGHYGLPFPDLRAENAAARFRQRLADIDREIDHRNEGRRVRYEYLKPSNIPNSISV
jgi:arachidonate 15-lipoxygenase